MIVDKLKVTERIQTILQQQGMTQMELAEQLGISQPAVSVYLQGRMPPPMVLLHIARLGNTTIEWLLTGESTQPPQAVKESPARYGNEVLLLDLWQRLPSKIQRNLLVLIRNIVEEHFSREEK